MTVKELILNYDPWAIDKLPISIDLKEKIQQLISIVRTFKDNKYKYNILLEVHLDEYGYVFGIDENNKIYDINDLELEDIMDLHINEWNFKVYTKDKVLYYIAKWLINEFPEIYDNIRT